MFEEFLRNGKVRKGDPDKARARSLLAMSGKTLAFAESVVMNDDNCSPLLVNYYEALREVCEAVCAARGFKVYSHEAFTFFLSEILKEDKIAATFDRLRKLRNGVNYFGEFVVVQETRAAAHEVKELMILLKRYVEV